MLSRQVAPLLPKFRKVSAYFTIANLDPSRRKYESRVQCRVGDRSHHRNRDGLRSNFHLLAFARVILKFFRLGHALYCLLPIAYCLSLLKTSPTAGTVAVSRPSAAVRHLACLDGSSIENF